MLKKGFTLIELLVTIAVVAVIAAAVLVAIDPIDKINQANDAKVQADIGQIATALNTYAVANNGTFPNTATWTTELSSEMSSIPKPPTAAGYGTDYTYSNASGVVKVSGTIKQKKYVNATPSLNAWMWCNTSGQAGPVASLTANCP